MGDYEQAREEFESVLALKLKYYSSRNHPDIASTYVEMSDFYVHRADYRTALRNLGIATHIFKDTLGRENAENAQIHEKLGRICLEKAKYDRA